MDRRNFLKLASAAGLSVVSPVVYGERGLKEPPRNSYAPYEGTMFFFVNAGGGWDPTSICDPKGAAYEDEPDRMNNYLTDDIGQAGNIRYAPVADNQGFFERHQDRTLVVNGIDMLTNGHDAGNRHTWSGRLSEGYPSMGATLAASYGVEQPLSYLTFGGYSETAGKVARTRAGNINVLERLAYPGRMDPGNEESGFHSERAREFIAKAQTDREVALLESQGLPHIRQSMGTLFTSRSGSNELRRLTEFLPETFSDNDLGRQAQLALAAFRAGVCVSASISIGGFDTHGNHDANAFPRIQQLTEGLDVLWQEAVANGIEDRVFVAIGSDFGRTPGYNDGAGKDHWAITSMMFQGAGVPGNRVIGSSTHRHQADNYNLDTLQPDPNGSHIEPGNIHQAIRRLAGIDQSELAAEFPIENQMIPLFNS